MALGGGVVLVLFAGLMAFRLLNFVGDVTGKRVAGDVTPTADAQALLQATATAQTRQCAVSLDCPTPGPNGLLQPTAVVPLPTLAATVTPDPSNSKIVQRIKAGERISVVYMGYGGLGHEGAYLTDTVLVLSFDPKSQTVSEYNIPRDLYLSVPGGPAGKTWKSKANGIFSTIMKWEKPTQDDLDPRYRWTNPKEQHDAAANLVANTVQGVLGFKIDYWLTMNFDAFRKLIDNMGGVQVCVDRAFVDNDYPRNDNDTVDAGVMTIKFDKGCQTMSGERAIEFARSRKSNSLEGGDFARSARQMKVIQAIKDEVLRRNLLTNAWSYMDALQGNLRVSMPPDELFSLATYFNSSEGKGVVSAVKFDPEIMDGNNLVQELDQGGAIGYSVIPQAGQDKYGDIQAWAKRSMTYALIRREQISLQVLNSTGVAGKANAVADFLADRGFRQAEPEASPVLDETTLFDYTEGKGAANVAQLKQFLPTMKVVVRTPDKKPYETAPGLMLYLGKDYKGINTAAVNNIGQGNAAPTPVKP